MSSTTVAIHDPVRYHNKASTLGKNISSTADISLAGRMVINEIVKAAGSLSLYLQTCKHRLHDSVYDFISENIDELQDVLDTHDELNYFDHDYFSGSTIVKLYLLRPHFGDSPVESPLQMYIRVMSFLYCKQGVGKVVTKFLELARHEYTPASPSLFNLGTKKPQGSSCFLLELGDDLDSILGTGVRDAGAISQHKGGLGIGLGRLRHSAIAGAGMASGVVPVARILDKLVTYVDQGGSRSGAGTAHLPAWHYDFWEFVNATNNFSQNHSLRLSHLNTSIVLFDLFFRRVLEKDGEWSVFCPAKAPLFGKYGDEFESTYLKYEKLAKEREAVFVSADSAYSNARNSLISGVCDETVVHKALTAKLAAEKRRIIHRTYNARSLLKHIANLEMKSGFPFTLHGDSINNKTNQANMGKVNSSNLCQEIMEVATPDTVASCNLHSVPLKTYVNKQNVCLLKARIALDVTAPRSTPEYTDQLIRAVRDSDAYNFSGLGHSTRSAVENLNLVIDRNYYPCPDKTEKLNKDSRPLGIGASGLSDVFCLLGFPYDSAEAEAMNKGIFACMYFNAVCASSALSRRDGAYYHFKNGEFDIEIATTDFPGSLKPKNVRPSECNPDSVSIATFEGSPASNGLFQFDLWSIRASALKAKGGLFEDVYRSRDDVPVDPLSWGQKPLWAIGGDYGDLEPWDRRPDKSYADHAIQIAKPTWESARETMMTHGLKNSLLLTIMPTASTAQIMRNAESTEAHSSNFYNRTVSTGRYIVVNQHLVSDLEELGLWGDSTIEYLVAFDGTMKNFSKFVKDVASEFYPDVTVDDALLVKLDVVFQKYKTMFEISQKTVLRYARQRGIYVCQSQSTNVFLEDPDLDQIMAVHTFGWKLGLKTGIYYLRQKGAADGAAFTLSARMLGYKRDIDSASGKVAPVAVVEEVTENDPSPSCTLAARMAGCDSCS